jgi:hypothetical protein
MVAELEAPHTDRVGQLQILVTFSAFLLEGRQYLFVVPFTDSPGAPGGEPRGDLLTDHGVVPFW